MKIQTFENAKLFLESVSELLRVDEVKNGLMLSLAERLIDDPNIFGPDAPWFYVVYDGTEICSAVLRTPPHYLHLSYFNGDPMQIASTVGEAIFAEHGNIPGVLGEDVLVNPFLEAWRSCSGSEATKRYLYEYTS